LYDTVQRRLVSLPAIRMPAWLEDSPAHPRVDPAATGAGVCGLSVSRRACEAVVVVTVRGRMDIDGAASVDHRLQQILAVGNLGCLVVDLSRVTHLDDYGVRTLLRAGDAARTTGTPLRVVTGDGAALEGLDQRGVRPLLPTAPDVDSACSEVFAPRRAHPRDVA
jgi:anti-anti-sigma factor